MRKISVIILLLSYIAFSSDVMISSHYCMNKLASTQLFVSGDKECSKCGMHIDDSHGCCRDEVKMVKMEDDQKVTGAVAFGIASFAPPVQVLSEFIVTSFYNAQLFGYTSFQPPPLLKGQETYLQHCVFRI